MPGEPKNLRTRLLLGALLGGTIYALITHFSGGHSWGNSIEQAVFYAASLAVILYFVTLRRR